MVKSQQQKIEDLLLLENNARYILHLINPKIILEPSSIEYRVVTERGIEQRLQLNKASEIDEVSGQISEYLQKIVAKTSDEKRAIKRLGYINDALNQLKDLTQVQAPGENDFESARTSLSTILLQDGVEVRFSGEADAGKSYRIIENTIKIAEQLGQGKIAEYLAMQLKKNKGFLGFGEPAGKYEGSININLLAADCFEGKMFLNTETYKRVKHYLPSKPDLDELLKAEEKKPFLNIDWNPMKEGAGKACVVIYGALGTGIRYIGSGLKQNLGGLLFLAVAGAIVWFSASYTFNEYKKSLIPNPVPTIRQVEKPHTKPTPQIQPTPHLTPADSNLVYNKK